MSVNCTWLGGYNRVWANPNKPPRKRFVGWFKEGRNIDVRYFPTRKAAIEWVQTKMKGGAA